MWSAYVLANVGVWIQTVGAAWLMTTLTSDALPVALVQTATTLPALLIGLPAGSLGDRRLRGGGLRGRGELPARRRGVSGRLRARVSLAPALRSQRNRPGARGLPQGDSDRHPIRLARACPAHRAREEHHLDAVRQR